MKKPLLKDSSGFLFAKINKLPASDKRVFVEFVMHSFKDLMEEAKWVKTVQSKPKTLNRLTAQAEKEIKNGQFEEFNPG